jgi:hypothetical protein
VSDKHASEANGLVTVTGGSTLKQLLSREAFELTDTTLTLVLTSRQTGRSEDTGDNSVLFGWGLPNDILCCGVGVNLILTDFYFGFNMLPQSQYQDAYRYLGLNAGAAAPNATVDLVPATDIIVSMSITSSTWKVDAWGVGLEVHQQGAYRPGVSPADLRAAAGGLLHPGVSVGRQKAGAVIDSLLLTRP